MEVNNLKVGDVTEVIANVVAVRMLLSLSNVTVGGNVLCFVWEDFLLVS